MGNSYSGGGSASEVPLHLCFFLLVLLLFLGFSWYTSYESAAESFAYQARIVLMASPFALLLAVRLLSSVSGEGVGRGVGDLLAVPMPERDSIHRAGGSPWGVGLLLLLLLVMVSYQSNFREKWFPLVSR
ncbi:unnamed protein product [Miscanthus lutarioriparius]|uniref:Uncharacterized protein n=1 Tax=Miscanthus lutarioriparius TaxID=422564 RepID=A0A811NM43_9POAL|nr:unnamed protein product [Miscanthus lutarioriparius]